MNASNEIVTGSVCANVSTPTCLFCTVQTVLKVITSFLFIYLYIFIYINIFILEL
jgi:hypothetical protein